MSKVCSRVGESVNVVRSIMLKQLVVEDEELVSKSSVDLSRFPP